MSFRDPFFHRPSKGGSVGARDYTKYVKWTPLKIGIVAFCIAVPYLLILVAIVLSTSIWVAIPLIILPILLGGVVGLLYRIAR